MTSFEPQAASSEAITMKEAGACSDSATVDEKSDEGSRSKDQKRKRFFPERFFFQCPLPQIPERRVLYEKEKNTASGYQFFVS